MDRSGYGCERRCSGHPCETDGVDRRSAAVTSAQETDDR